MPVALEKEPLNTNLPIDLRGTYKEIPGVKDQEFIHEGLITAAVNMMAFQIATDYGTGSTIHLILPLKGSMVFGVDLMRGLSRNSVKIKPHFVYGGSGYKKSTIAVTDGLIVNSVGEIDVKGEDVLIGDDIYDTGNSFLKVLNEVNSMKPASVRGAVLLDKPARRAEGVLYVPNYQGFIIPNKWVLGYGMDRLDNDDRELPSIWVDNELSNNPPQHL